MIRFGRLKIRDFKVISRADLELSDRGLVLVHGVNTDTEAADSNGAGKSTIFEALSWVLFGEIIGGARLGDEVIRYEQERAEVSVDFERDGVTYTVVRKRTPRTGSLTLLTDGTSTTGRTLGETEARIQELLGLDWPAFRNTVLHGQGDRSRFANRETPDSERKAILKRILRLDRFDTALEAARARRKELASQLDRLNGEMSRARVEAETARAAVARFRRLSETWVTDHARRLAELERETPAPSPKDVKLADALPRMLAIQKDLEARSAEVEQGCKVARAARASWEGKIARSRGALSGAEGELARAQRARERFKGAGPTHGAETCPTCGQAVDHSESAASRIEAERERLDEAVGAAQDRVIGLKTEIERLSGDEPPPVDETNPWRAKSYELAPKISDARLARQRVNTALAAQARRDRDLDRLLAETDPNVESIAQFEAKVDAAELVLQESSRSAEHAVAQCSLVEFWVEAFSNRGLPSLALDTVVPLISEAANRYLRILSDGDLRVEVSTTTELKGGGEKDSISLRFHVEGTPDVQPSGGQWRKFGIAIDLALMDLVASREGARIDLLLLDEVLDGLDAEGRARMVALLRTIRETRSSVFVVSHDPQVSESFERRITVRKAEGASVVEEG